MKRGLNSEEVLKYANEGKTNKIKNSASKTVPEIIRKNLFTYFNLIFLILSILI